MNPGKRKEQTLRSVGRGAALFVIMFAITKRYNGSLCILKNLFGVSCIGCGLTRGFVSVLKLNFKSAAEYNILSVPIFAGIVIYSFFALIDFVFDKEFILSLEKQLSKGYMYILYVAVLAAAFAFNNAW